MSGSDPVSHRPDPERAAPDQPDPERTQTARAELERESTEPASAFLNRSMRWWNLAFLLIFLVVSVVVLLDDLSVGRTVIALATLALLVAAYLAIGRQALLHDRHPGIPVAIGYLLLSYVGTLLTMYLSSIGSLLFFVAFMNTWMMLPVLWAVIGSVLFTGGIVITSVGAAGWTSSAWSSGLATGGGTAVVGILLGLWVTGVVNESEQRQLLIAELERTRSELGEAEHRAGAFAERERLAAEIHDTIAQGLLSIVVHSRAVEADDPELEQRIRRIERITEENLAEARGLIEALQPAELREHSLPDACGRVSGRFGTDTGITVRFETEGEPRPLPANTEVVLLRAVQEALANVHKHANARVVDIVLAYRTEETAADTVLLTVTDDGVGFHVPDQDSVPWAPSGHRAGLRAMRNRVEQIDGRVEVTSSPGAGTTISLEVPS